jgi:hypothetical protein
MQDAKDLCVLFPELLAGKSSAISSGRVVGTRDGKAPHVTFQGVGSTRLKDQYGEEE